MLNIIQLLELSETALENRDTAVYGNAIRQLLQELYPGQIGERHFCAICGKSNDTVLDYHGPASGEVTWLHPDCHASLFDNKGNMKIP